LRRKKTIITIIFLAAVAAATAHAEDRSVVDQMGRTITVPEDPKRVVSLAPNITEILFAVGAGEKVVGVSGFSDYPKAARSLPKVGTYIKPNLERIVELSPDLVIATADGEKEKEMQKLQVLGIPVYVINPTDIPGIITTVREIGVLVSEEEGAEKLARGMETRIDDVRARVGGLKRVKVLLTLSMEPIITMSSGTFQDDLINIAGGVNIASGERVRYPRFSMEEIIVRAPEVIVITTMSPGGADGGAVKVWSRFKAIPAVAMGRIYTIDSDIVDRPSPRIVDGLCELARLLHPGAFSKGGAKGGADGN
jgi:iron complex transport system substrate-binding protein